MRIRWIKNDVQYDLEGVQTVSVIGDECELDDDFAFKLVQAELALPLAPLEVIPEPLIVEPEKKKKAW